MKDQDLLVHMLQGSFNFKNRNDFLDNFNSLVDIGIIILTDFEDCNYKVTQNIKYVFYRTDLFRSIEYVELIKGNSYRLTSKDRKRIRA